MNNVERGLAIDALIEITSGAYNNITVRKTLNRNNALKAVQKAFITELVNGTLRNLIYIDYVINKFSKISTVKMKSFILNNLRIAVYQILFMDRTPNSAACNEAVEITKKRGFINLTGFVNGVLRKIASTEEIPLPKNKIQYLSVKYSYPEWIINYWLNEMDISCIEKMCICNSLPPKISICTNVLKIDTLSLYDILVFEGMAVESGQTSSSLTISKTSDITKSEAFSRGLFHVMDESSMLAVNVLNPVPGSVVMDVCGAPGGKSFFAAYLMSNNGKIITRDIHEHKINLINEQAKRLDINIIQASIADASIFDPKYEESIDYLILDVPCSGLGLIRKKPDIKYTKSLKDIESLSELQKNIFKACWQYVKKGGILVYCTCTVSDLENTENVRYFLENYPFEPIYFEHQNKGTGCIQILPDNTDGFFIAKMRRK